jgi:aryl-alcohol dehydrogenase-like predicted oxidoreductase
VDENVRAADITLPDDLVQRIDDTLGSVVRYER